MIELCSTCLCADRRLVPLKSLEDVLISLSWLNINFNSGNHVCWECKAILKKICNYKEQALRAQALLQKYTAEEKQCPLQNLSNLSISIKDTYDETIIHTNVIKEEIYFNDEIETLKTHDEISTGERGCFKTDIDSNEIPSSVYPFKHAGGYCNDASTREIKLLKTEVDGDMSTEEIGSFKSEVAIEGDFTSKNKEQSIKKPVQNKESTASAISKLRKKKSDNKQDRTLRYNPTNLLSKHSISKVEERFLVRKLSMEDVIKARESDKSSSRYVKCQYKCDKCITSYFTEDKYKYHVEKHHLISVGNLVCPVCEVRFKRQDTLDYHHDCHFRSYQCRQCNYEHHKLTTMLTHMDKEHEMKKFNCKHCNEVLPSLRKLRYHREKYHKGIAKCNICRNIFSTTNALRQHMKIHEDMPFLECTICHKKCRGNDNLKSHIEKVHSEKAEQFYCKPCDRFFNSKTVYLTHIKTTRNHVTSKLECDYCGKKFFGKTPLVYHIKKSHMSDEKFECNLCFKKFVANCKLNTHIKNVHGDKSKREKKHMCSECGKAFKVITVYKHHMRIHTGEKPFQCQYCPWKFRQQSTLSTHQKLKHKDIVGLQHNIKEKKT